MVIGALTAAFLEVFLYGGWQMSGDEINAIRSLKLIGENSQNPMTGELRGRQELIRDLACSSREDILSAMKQTSYEKAMQM